MAEAVEAALADKRHLIVEAGTGTGKTLAYLVPALLSGKRIVVSTGTKNLQEQLFFKDVPFLQQHFARPLKVCYMKGRNNYACRQKIYDAGKEPVLAGLEEVADFEIIQRMGEDHRVRRPRRNQDPARRLHRLGQDRRAHAICARGQKCPNFERCFITLMHQRAAESDIIIVNHHLFFADLSLKRRKLRRRHSAGVRRRGVRRSPRHRRRRRPVLRRLRQQLPSAGAAARYRGHGPQQEVRHAGAGPHSRPAGRDDRAVLRPFRRRRAARGLPGPRRRSARRTKRSTRTCWRRWI